jgi:putative redox protein
VAQGASGVTPEPGCAFASVREWHATSARRKKALGMSGFRYESHMNTVDCETERPNEYRQRLVVRAHELHADMGEDEGGHDSAPGAHDYFDVALAACKTLTATWYARKNGIPLERVESHVERDASEERAGRYKLKVRLAFHGPMTDEQRSRIYAAIGRCPVHKLMTSTEVIIETAPLETG